MSLAGQDEKTRDNIEVMRSTRRELARLATSLRQHLSYQAIMGLEWLPSKWATTIKAQPESMDEIRVDLGECIRCRLHSHRTHIVFGEGNPSARVVLVGEGPGREEDRMGRPFVGPAGKLLDLIIASMGWRRQEVYICNVIKCRPPKNRDPLPDEIEACGPFLRRQLQAIRPQAILALGSFAAQFLLSSQQPISRLRNQVHQFEGIPVVPTYHPAYLLRNPLQKRQAWKDVQLLLSLLHKGDS
ncbi:MAG: uracil-DNA glycosylase [Deltaproteobacteria bacterium]|jgi:uracil-DNA glycosylase family 4|nr:uracil-DNA glycosylase [Deltaproteobacteria bacterium]